MLTFPRATVSQSEKSERARARCCPHYKLLLPRRKFLCALELWARHAASHIGLERRPRWDHLEQSHAEIQARADHDIGGREVFTENPWPFLEGTVEHVDHALRVTPTGGNRIHLDLGGELYDRRLDAA